MPHELISEDGRFRFRLQNDGNVVTEVIATGEVLFAATWAGGILKPDAPFPPAPPTPSLPDLTIEGQFFRSGGAPWTAIECSDFNLLNRWQHGEEIRPILEQRRDVGFNLLRVWTLYDLLAANIGQFLDIDYGRLPEFVALCASHGLYVEFTAYTSLERFDHWPRLGVVAQHCAPKPLLELVNEGDLAVNRIDMARYAPIFGVLCSHGSGSSEHVPTWEPWDYGTLHYNDADEWQRKTAHNPMEDFGNVFGRPCISNENTRYPDKDQSLTKVFDAAAGAALLTAGSCFHSVAGKNSTLWTGLELEAAKSWAAGARSVNLACQSGAYRRRDDLLTPDLLRVYQRGDCLVSIRK